MLTVLDRSNYLKGLLILARQDQKLVEPEKDFIRDVAKRFGFSRDFYEDILKSLMANKYIKEEPVIFSSAAIAEDFITEGLSLAMSDNKLDDKELIWLKKIASANNVSDETFKQLVQRKPSDTL